VIERLRVKRGEAPQLHHRDPGDKLGLAGKAEARLEAGEQVAALYDLQRRLWAEGRRALLVVLQAMDCGGKDGAIRSVFTGVNPQGVHVVSFGPPSEDDLARDYLWRVHQKVPRRGEIGIFNRSHYEDVLVVRVHGLVPESRWRPRYGHIRAFEKMLTDEGTTVVKVFLHISRDEQRARLQARLDDPTKRWKFRAGDLDDRAKWSEFQAAYEDAIAETSTDDAPWYVVPADRKWVRNVAVGRILVHTLTEMAPQYPPLAEDLAGITVH
jgi:PPK2 family polyphosphate:nucleotide phosphotransferase